MISRRAGHQGVRIACWVIPAVVACAVAGAQAGTIDVPGTYLTIQEAIEAAEPGDQIHVAPGRYFESIDFKGKPIHVLATEGPQVTFLDGTDVKTSLVRCVSGEDKRTVLEGFRIVSGNGDPSFYGPEATVGGGMIVMGSSPTVRRCVFEGNNASYNGGGLFNGGGRMK